MAERRGIEIRMEEAQNEVRGLKVLAANPCVARDYQHGSVVCVCNSTYCDTFEPITAQQLAGRTLRHYVSSKAGKRFSAMDMSFSDSVDASSASAVYSVDQTARYQEILGFGGAPTDSASINIQSLSAGAKRNLLRSYFGEDGIGYTFLRVPMGGCDFSPRNYEYMDDHPGDTELKNFNLTDEDFLYKAPRALSHAWRGTTGPAASCACATRRTATAWTPCRTRRSPGASSCTSCPPRPGSACSPMPGPSPQSGEKYTQLCFFCFMFILLLPVIKGIESIARSGAAASAVFTVVPSTTYQEMLGFGGALSDTTAYNIYSLSEQAKETLIQTYFGKGGAQYLFLRINMGSTDFSLKYYTYDDVVGDITLSNFSLVDMDTKYKIPLLKHVSKVRGQNLKLFTTPWSAPLWMKSSGSWFNGTLQEKYYGIWANYFTKFLDAYKKEGVEFWGLTPQNEPNVVPSNYPVMGWLVAQINEFVGKHLGPALQKTGYGGLKMMALDDNRNHLPAWADRIFNDATAGKYYSGVAVHWYNDHKTDPGLLTTTHNNHPTKFLFYTEACNLKTVVSRDYGDWEIGEKYGTSMMQAFNNWVGGWTDWNLAVNLNGGPATYNGVYQNYAYNGAVIVNATGDEFYKQPPYYFQAHFSMFVPPGSRRIGLNQSSDGGLANVAFLTPQQEYVVVLINNNATVVQTQIKHTGKGSIDVSVPARSINTIIYK
ncbi:putative glucosylceramidase 4 [Bacillus rossius redtenbacheri]|uniref:putative glucosylceramidase 4 n=1 Tax=Bacillus rossius redtenbacheri TaxID=93214 RepID=UPI002FDEEA5F